MIFQYYLKIKSGSFIFTSYNVVNALDVFKAKDKVINRIYVMYPQVNTINSSTLASIKDGHQITIMIEDLKEVSKEDMAITLIKEYLQL